MIESLQTPRLRLIPPDHSHIDLIFRLRSDPAVLRWSDRAPFTQIDEARKLADRLITGNADGSGASWILVDISTDSSIGSAGVWRIDRDHCLGELGYNLLPQYWRQGYMKEALPAIINYAFGRLNLHRLEANINPGNTGSARLLQSLGFQLEARLRQNYFFDGNFIDTHLYARLASDSTTD